MLAKLDELRAPALASRLEAPRTLKHASAARELEKEAPCVRAPPTRRSVAALIASAACLAHCAQLLAGYGGGERRGGEAGAVTTRAADLVVADFSVNDRASGQDWVTNELGGLAPRAAPARTLAHGRARALRLRISFPSYDSSCSLDSTTRRALALWRAQAQPKRLLSRASPSVRGGLAVAGRAARRVGHVGAGGRVARAAAGRVGLLAGGLRELLFERKQLI